jgi:hypothetical protein
MDLSATFGQFKPGKSVLTPEHFFCIVLQKVGDPGLKILLNNNGILIDSFHFVCSIAKFNWRFPCYLSSRI